jgi:hypothetical protein
MCMYNLCDTVNVICAFYLSVCFMETVIRECNMYFALLLQSWSLVLRQGQILSVFNTRVMRNLVPYIHEVTERLVKLHNSFVASLI